MNNKEGIEPYLLHKKKASIEGRMRLRRCDPVYFLRIVSKLQWRSKNKFHPGLFDRLDFRQLPFVRSLLDLTLEVVSNSDFSSV